MAVTCLHLCTSNAWGGLELYACTLMVELQKAGCRVLAICKPNSKIELFLKQHQIKTFILPSYSVPSLKSIRFIKSLLQEEKIDVVHVHFHTDVWHASLAMRDESECKLFLSVYMGVTPKNDILHRFIYSRVNAIFSSSEELNDRLPSLYAVPKSKVHLLPYGRIISNYQRDKKKRAEIRSKYGIAPDEILVGTMVRIDPGKGAMDFARSFSYIGQELQSNIKYLIVGEPTRKGRLKPNESPFEEHCEAYQKKIQMFIEGSKLDEKIMLAGFQTDLIGYLSAMDIFVFPSRDELYSLVVLDAMCMGLPIVAARAGGNIRQIQDRSNGLLYEVANSEDLAEKLSEYIRSFELRKRHGLVARSFIEEQHDMGKTVIRLLDFYSRTY